MSALVAVLSQPTVAELLLRYTTPDLVSQVTGGEIAEDEVLPEWIEWAMDEIEKKTGMQFRPTAFTDYLDGSGENYVFTESYPLIEVSSVEMDGIVIPPSEYAVNKKTGKVTLKCGVFDEGAQNVAVTGTCGKTKVPATVQKLATLIAAKTALSARNGPLVDNESLGDFSQNRSFKKLNDELDHAWESVGKRFGVSLI